jgi:2-phosphosulfolactate phosphatase
LNAEPRQQKLILTPTNGTRAIQKAYRGAGILIGCFLNATACIKEALSRRLDITLFCAGSRQKYAHEDCLAAGLLIHHAKTINPNLRICDMGKTLEISYQQCANTLLNELRNSTTGKRLLALNYDEDVHFCSQVDLFQLVPIVKDKRILSLSPS